jgi:serine/threonine protein kinase
MSVVDPDPLPAHSVAEGRFLLHRLLGQGGEGRVFLATDRRTGRRVVVKTLLPGRADRADAHQRLRREARALQRVRHPGIPALVHFGSLAGEPALVQEYADGVTFEAQLEDGPRLAEDAAAVILALQDILEAVHAAGLVHRDVKPANIVRNGTQVRLLDFGCAYHRDLRRLTALGYTPGTPSSVAPELLLGACPVGPWVDHFGVGMTLYRAVTGELPDQAQGPIARALRSARSGRGFDPREVRADVPAPLAEAVLSLTDPQYRRRAARAAGAFARLREAYARPTDTPDRYAGRPCG